MLIDVMKNLKLAPASPHNTGSQGNIFNVKGGTSKETNADEFYWNTLEKSWKSSQWENKQKPWQGIR